MVRKTKMPFEKKKPTVEVVNELPETWKEHRDRAFEKMYDHGNNAFGQMARGLPRALVTMGPLMNSAGVGGAFSTVSPFVTKAGLAAALVYSGADVMNKAWLASAEDRTRVMWDAAIWHGAATVTLPVAAVGSVTYTADYLVRAMKMGKSAPGLAKVIPMAAGFACLPFIMEPISRGTTFAMNQTVRKLL